ncbi:hypothetical protein TNCT_308751 [Trichonephila clavata]|uniref:Transposase n=1 Tax=Trichonephila clavata TaxID=2740835 RepID=A0A8X6L2B3_TRICU|nr:hypothetical protein TNCT_308751 [Trichonephila clavata]
MLQRSVNTPNNHSSYFNGGFSNEESLHGNWILHRGNASSHISPIVSKLLDKMGMATLPQPPYSPDLAPSDFFLFPRIKRTLKGTRHGTPLAVQVVHFLLDEGAVDTLVRSLTLPQ